MVLLIFKKTKSAAKACGMTLPPLLRRFFGTKALDRKSSVFSLGKHKIFSEKALAFFKKRTVFMRDLLVCGAGILYDVDTVKTHPLHTADAGRSVGQTGQTYKKQV